MRVLITGAAGRIGAMLAARLPRFGYELRLRRWWSLEAGHAIGYEPRDDAETSAADLIDKPPSCVRRPRER